MLAPWQLAQSRVSVRRSRTKVAHFAGDLTSSVTAITGAPAASARVLRVGTYNGITGQYATIQAAVNAAKPGDWILVGPGDYKEQGYAGETEPAGVLITTANLHLRGMNRNTVVVDGTKPGARQK